MRRGEFMKFYLSEAKKEEKEILYRLLQYSLYEESETDLNEMNEDAIYEYKYFNYEKEMKNKCRMKLKV